MQGGYTPGTSSSGSSRCIFASSGNFGGPGIGGPGGGVGPNPQANVGITPTPMPGGGDAPRDVPGSSPGNGDIQFNPDCYMLDPASQGGFAGAPEEDSSDHGNPEPSPEPSGSEPPDSGSEPPISAGGVTIGGVTFGAGGVTIGGVTFGEISIPDDPSAWGGHARGEHGGAGNPHIPTAPNTYGLGISWSFTPDPDAATTLNDCGKSAAQIFLSCVLANHTDDPCDRYNALTGGGREGSGNRADSECADGPLIPMFVDGFGVTDPDPRDMSGAMNQIFMNQIR